MALRKNKLFLPALVAAAAVLVAAAAHAPSAGGVSELKIASSAAAAGGAAAAVATAGSVSPMVSVAVPHPEPEQQLISVIDTFRRGEVDAAIAEAQSLIDAKPNFRLAHLVYGDLLASRAGVPLSFQSKDMPDASVDLLMDEARQRWKHYRTSKRPDRVPQPLVQLSGSQKNALVVDLAASRLFVFENSDGGPRLRSDYYVSGGKNGAHKQRQGDRRTPVGVYFVVDRLPGENLPDKYGPVAFPVDYPNEWDLRHGRTGGGIWLHGVASSTYSRPPLDSDGCVALTNSELEMVAPLLEAGSTPVLIAEQISWISSDAMAQRRQDIMGQVEQWRNDWESGRVERYLGHYSQQFHGRGMDKKAWDAYKANVTRNKRYIRVALEDISVFGHPHEQDMMVVSFSQQYESDRFSSNSRKRQYWRLEDGRWRIISEENVSI